MVERKIQEFEARSATFDIAEQNRRVSMFEHFSAINKFEGMIPSPIDRRMFQLLVDGKISTQEYLDLCLMDARGNQ